MKKIVLDTFKKLSIVEAPIPSPGPEQVVVRMRFAGICGSDLHVFDGLHPSARVPLVMGHEGCGEIYAVNSSRTDLKAGDKVCIHTVLPCRSCEACASGRENLCEHIRIMGTNFDGVFTQYMLADASRVIRFDASVDDRIAALAEPLTVAVHDIRRADIRAGESVLICGAGPIGLIIAIMAQFSGASRVALSEIDPARIQIAQSLGFAVFNPLDANFDRACLLASGGGFDKAFEITSVQSGFDACLRLLRKGGVMVQVGMPPAGRHFDIDINKIIYSECGLRGVRHHTMRDMQTAVKLINSGVLNDRLAPLVSKIYPLEQCQEAMECARSDKSALRVLIDLQEH